MFPVCLCRCCTWLQRRSVQPRCSAASLAWRAGTSPGPWHCWAPTHGGLSWRTAIQSCLWVQRWSGRRLSVDDFGKVRHARGKCLATRTRHTCSLAPGSWCCLNIPVYRHARAWSCTAAPAWRKPRGAVPAPVLAPAHLSASTSRHGFSVTCKTGTWIRGYASACAVSPARRCSSTRGMRWCRGRRGRARASSGPASSPQETPGCADDT
jgi:hypothetical protein